MKGLIVTEAMARIIDRQRFKRIYPFYKPRPQDGVFDPEGNGGDGSSTSPNATYVVINSDPALPNERLITPGGGMNGSDGGAGGAYTLSVDPNQVAFLSGSTFVRLSVDNHGRSADAINPNISFFVSGSSVFSGSITSYAAITGSGFAVADSMFTTDTSFFTFTSGSQSFVVPADVTSLRVKMWGGGGGAGNYASAGGGGPGGFAAGTVAVVPGSTLTILVAGGGKAPASATANGGEGGWPGGGYGTRGDASGAGGGGYSGIFTGSVTQGNAIMIAGGGGGSTGFTAGSGGGGGGGSVGGPGGSIINTNGGGGTQASGGTGGGGAAFPVAGSALQGGVAYSDRTTAQVNDAGGGGGGYFGGGAGQGDGRSGGGGSGYFNPAYVTDAVLLGVYQGSSGAVATFPSGSTDPQYVSPAGRGAACGTDGANGLVVISYGAATTKFTSDRVSFSSDVAGVVYATGSLHLFDSNGVYTLSQLARSGTIGADPGAQYLTLAATASLPNERVFSPSTGLIGADAGAGGNYTLAINNNAVATITGSRFTGPINAAGGLTGSLQRLPTGESYLAGGGIVFVTTGSNGQIVVNLVSGTNGQFPSNIGGVITWGNRALFYTGDGTAAPEGLLRGTTGAATLVAARTVAASSVIALANDASSGIWVGSNPSFTAGSQAVGLKLWTKAASTVDLGVHTSAIMSVAATYVSMSAPLIVGAGTVVSDTFAFLSGSTGVLSGSNRKVVVLPDLVISGNYREQIVTSDGKCKKWIYTGRATTNTTTPFLVHQWTLVSGTTDVRLNVVSTTANVSHGGSYRQSAIFRSQAGTTFQDTNIDAGTMATPGSTMAIGIDGVGTTVRAWITGSSVAMSHMFEISVGQVTP